MELNRATDTSNLMPYTLCLIPAGSELMTGKLATYVRKRKATQHGFTLMEILLAFLILGIVVTAVLASFNAVFSTTDTLNTSSRYYEMAKSCLNRMTLDLGAIYARQSPPYKKPEFNDPPDSYRLVGATMDVGGTSFATIRFTSGAHVPLENTRRQGIAEIIYYAQALNNGQVVLRRADSLYPYPEFEERASDPVLCNNLKSLAFKYIDTQGEEFDEWDSDSSEVGYATPAAIRIALEIGDETISYNFETTVRLATRRAKIE